MGLAERLNRNEEFDSVAYPSTGAHTTLQMSQSVDHAIDMDEFRHLVHEDLKQLVGKRLYAGELTQDELSDAVYKAISNVLNSNSLPLTIADRATLVQEIVDDILGNGPLEQLLRDTEVSEIMVARYDKIYVERHGHLLLTDLVFNTEEHLRKTIDRIVGKVGRRIDESSPLVDARLLDGSRVNAAVPPVSLDGATLTIRKFFKEMFTSNDMVITNTISQQALNMLEACVRGRMNIVISGGTGSGKTTTLNVMSGFIPEDERIVTLEDSAELQLNKPHVIRMETRPMNTEGHGEITIRDLVKNSLRMRPDRIVVGEVRDAAALDMLQAMNTGHDGSLTTVHANSPSDALSRLETMSLMSGMDLPVSVIREQISRAVDLVVQQSRLRDGSRKITSVTEIGRDVDGKIETFEIFKFVYYKEAVNGSLGQLQPTGVIPKFMERLTNRGVSLDEAIFKA